MRWNSRVLVTCARWKLRWSTIRQLLQPGDVNDPESYKVRRGKIGGYVDYLDPSDVEYADQAMSALDPRFGYQK